jgi:inosine-uridine nucleoside N-ribohydrolase
VLTALNFWKILARYMKLWQRKGHAMRRKIILDCDTGRDDAIAIALACASPDELDLLEVTTVAGNIPLPLTERNNRMVLEAGG